MTKQLSFLGAPQEIEAQPRLEVDMHAEWFRRTGMKPTWTGRDFAALRRLMKRGIEREEIWRRWLAYLDSTDSFIHAQGWGLRYFAEHFDSFAWGPIVARPKDREAQAELNVGRNRNG